jgi:serine/threonine-protein phosphatase CPPED1
VKKIIRVVPAGPCKNILEVIVKRRFAFLFALIVILAIPVAGQEQPFYFLMLADTQLGMYANNSNFIRETANFEFTVATVNRLKPGFVVILGDLTNKAGDAGQIREFKRIAGKIDPSVPVFYAAGNHDVDREPTPESLASYRQNFGRDYYSFRVGPVYGIVLNSVLIHSPRQAESESQAQIVWLKAELEKAKASGAQIVVFQHHPYFVEKADEADQYGIIPLERRPPVLQLLHQYNVKYVFAGHVHKNFVAQDGDLEMTTSGPVSMCFGEEGSGIRLAEVTAAGIKHRFYPFGRMPDALSLK